MDTSLSISSILTALHTHIQNQTQLLPTLHTQLGLPPSALVDELSSLQQRLADCVEKQIESRQREVDTWVTKCNGVEEECMRYSRSLGSHIKIIGASVGELRKQHVLPVRHEMLSSYQDKLDQLYRTKLEQLATLTTRILNLSRILGPTFYSPDITDPIPAQGENSMDPLARRDVNPERFAKLEKELVRGKGELTRRLNHLYEMMVQIDWLFRELEIPLPPVDDLCSFGASSTSLSIPTLGHCRPPSRGPPDIFSSSIIQDMSTPTPDSRRLALPGLMTAECDDASEYHRTFSRFVQRMDELESEGREAEPNSLVGLNGVEPTIGLMKWAKDTKDELETIKKDREVHIQAMYNQLEALWKRLGVEEQDIEEFVEANRGSSESNVRAYEAELERMLEIKRERMSVFVGNARAEIEALWDELMVGEEERADFTPFDDDEHTEELLILHEDEIARLKEDRRTKGPLLVSIRKYFEICEEEKELAATASDQSRLLGRGHRDPGRLLREEKMRKRVNREKPKLEQDLLRSIPAWEQANGRQFLVNSNSIVEQLAEAVGATERENARKKPRAGSVPPARPSSSMSTASHAPQVARKKPRLDCENHIPSLPRSTSVPPTYSQHPRIPLGNAGRTINSSPPHSAAVPRKPSNTIKKLAQTAIPRPAASHLPKSYGADLGIGHAPYGPKGTRNGSISNGQTDHQASQSNLRSSRNRRESFKPRPSTDDVWDGGVPAAGGGHWMTANIVREEEEY